MNFYRQCWTSDEYTHDKDGYMKVRWQGQLVLAHRLAFFLYHGRWPYVCRHTCDNPPCYNPTHLVDGTHADNTADMVQRGRARGAKRLNLGMPSRRWDKNGYYREMYKRKKEGTWNAR